MIIINDKSIVFYLKNISVDNFNNISDTNIIFETNQSDNVIYFNFNLSNINEITNKFQILFSKIIDNHNNFEPIIKINTTTNTDIINWILEKKIFDTIIFGSKYNQINSDIIFNTNVIDNKIKNIIYENKFLCSINSLPDHLDNLKIRFSTIKNFQIKLPKKLKLLTLNELVIDFTNFNIDDVGIICCKKISNNILEIINSNFVCWYKYYENIIDINNLPSKIKILYLLDDFNENIDFLPDTIEKIVLGPKFNKSIENLPLSIRIIELRYQHDNLNFISQLHEQIEVLQFNIKKCNITENKNLFAQIIFPKSIKTIVYVVPRGFTRITYEFAKILKYHMFKKKLKFDVLSKKK